MAISFIGLIFLLLAGCGVLLVTIVGGKMVSQALCSRQPTEAPQASSGIGSVIGGLFGMGILLAIFAVPVLLLVSYQRVDSRHIEPDEPASAAVVYTSSQSDAVDVSESDANEGEAESEAVELAEAPIVLPDWVRAEPKGSVVVVESLPSVTEDDARADAHKKASELLLTKYNGAAIPGSWSIDPDRVGAIRKTYTEQIPWDFSAGTDFSSTSQDLQDGKAFRTYLQVDTGQHVQHAMYTAWRSGAARRRVEVVTVASGLMVGAVALLAVFFRVEKRGFFRRTARVGALLGSLGLVIGSCGVAADGLDGPIGPAPIPPGHDHSATHISTTRADHGSTGQTGTSNFAGLKIHGNRIGFVVVGDQQLTDEAKPIAKEIARCINGFEHVNFKVFCDTHGRRSQYGGVAGYRKQTTRPAIERQIRNNFQNGGAPGFPHKTLQNVSGNFNPDRVIIICRNVNEFGDEASHLTEAFDVPADVFEFDGNRLVRWSEDCDGGQCD